MTSPEPAHDLQNVLPAAEMPWNETSPDSKCPICLDRFNNISYADRCLHRFCFLCILEWGKNKAECPLCKQPFSSVYHSIRSEDDFKLYELRPVENGSFGNVQGQRFRYRTTLTHGLRRERQARRSSRNQDVMRFRRWLYRHAVRAQGVQDGGRSRDTSAEFFRKNPACLHRLVPWLKRELAVLYGSHDSVADVVLHVILSLITRHNMQDEAFLRELHPFLLSRTEHFLHEFLSFAKSPFNMEAYDLRAIYNCHAPFQLSAVSEAGSGLSSALSPWDDETPGPSYSSTTQSVFTVTISDSDVDSTSEDEEETVHVNANTNANINISHAQRDEDDHSSDGDCVIVGFIKPTAQRTPELVQLSSDSEASVQEDKKMSTSKQLDARDLTNQRRRNTVAVPSHSATGRSSKSKHRDRGYSSHSHRQCSRSYKDRGGHKKASHRSHHRHTDIYYSQDTPQQSRARSQSKTPSPPHLFSRTRARTCSRSRSRSSSESGSRARSRFRSLDCWRPRSRERWRLGSREYWRSRSRDRSRPRSRERSQSRSLERSHYRTHARSSIRTRVRSYSRNQRMQTSPKNRKCSRGLTVSPAPSSHWRSSCDRRNGKSKHKSSNGEKRKRKSRERHHHHPKKNKKSRRRRSSSMEDVAERRKHHKKKKKHKKERRSRRERMGRSSEPSSPTVIAILTDTQSAEGAMHPRSATPTNTKLLNFSHGAATCANTAHQNGTTSNCVKDKTLLSKSPRVSTSSHFPENILPLRIPPQTCRASLHHISNADSLHHPSNTDSLQNTSPNVNSPCHASSNSDSPCRASSNSDTKPNSTSSNFDSLHHDSSNSPHPAPSNADSLHNSSSNASSLHYASST